MADLEVAVVVAGLSELVRTSEAYLLVDRLDVAVLNLTLAGHGWILVRVVAEAVNSSLVGHGNVAVDNLCAKSVGAMLLGHESALIDGLSTTTPLVRRSEHGSVEVSGSAESQMRELLVPCDYFDSDTACIAITGKG